MHPEPTLAPNNHQAPQPAPDEAHAHRWRIEGQAGPTSTGSCACGAERSFPNSTAEAITQFRGRNTRSGGPSLG